MGMTGRRVIELGAGAHGLASMLAARCARCVVASDGCPLVVQRLADNQRRNAAKVIETSLHVVRCWVHTRCCVYSLVCYISVPCNRPH